MIFYQLLYHQLILHSFYKNLNKFKKIDFIILLGLEFYLNYQINLVEHVFKNKKNLSNKRDEEVPTLPFMKKTEVVHPLQSQILDLRGNSIFMWAELLYIS